MKSVTTLALAVAFAITSGIAMAQSVGNGGNPARANTTDPNSAPMMGSQGTQNRTTGQKSRRHRPRQYIGSQQREERRHRCGR